MQLNEFVKSLPLGKILHIERYKKGLHNDTYKIVSVKGNFSLRIYILSDINIYTDQF